jgi:hypothetical protein
MSNPSVPPSDPSALREAIVRIRAHTSYINPTMELLSGLLASIERIADAALEAPAPSPAADPSALRALLEQAQLKLLRAANLSAGATSAEDAANEAVGLASEAEWLVHQARLALAALVPPVEATPPTKAEEKTETRVDGQ